MCISSDFDSSFGHTRTIRDHYVFLVDNLDAKHSGLVGELYSADVLSRQERDTICCELTSFAQNEKLLSMLSRKTKHDFEKFLDAMDKTGQAHVRNHITGRQRLLCFAFLYSLLGFTIFVCRHLLSYLRQGGYVFARVCLSVC